ncbi:hypothetical protein, partial [Stenotrophomonas sp.]|uniref:hypothetical protein n=1 Tax=Stenotrophomonas sp. TaxID=69392 RepID=UPI0028B07E47
MIIANSAEVASPMLPSRSETWRIQAQTAADTTQTKTPEAFASGVPSNLTVAGGRLDRLHLVSLHTLLAL